MEVEIMEIDPKIKNSIMITSKMPTEIDLPNVNNLKATPIFPIINLLPCRLIDLLQLSYNPSVNLKPNRNLPRSHKVS